MADVDYEFEPGSGKFRTVIGFPEEDEEIVKEILFRNIEIRILD